VTRSIYGLRVQSNRPIPRVGHSATAKETDLRVSLGTKSDFPSTAGERAWYASDHRDERGVPALVISKSCDDAWFHLRYSDGTEFVVDNLGTRLWAAWPEHLTVEDTATYLLGPVMGFILLLRGTHCLHASAFDVGGRAVALVGPAGAGKSTTAAAFAKLGYAVLSDDVVTLAAEKNGAFHVHPAYPCIRLWPESVEGLFGSADALPLLTPNWDKRYLDLEGDRHRYQADPLRLAAIYVLAERSASDDTPRVEAIAPQLAMIELVGNAYAPRLKDRAARAAEFEVLSRVMETVPVRRAIPNADLGNVDRLCEVILDDIRKLTQPHTPTRAATREWV
jgi:hypothetical protein